jgi:hypothetical protein
MVWGNRVVITITIDFRKLDNMLSWIVFNSVSSLKETVGG